ncbi:SpoIIE family protein phosphatase [Planotetraspora sp. GP83]|uniref:SpoIIE family protein phosphatase n=1 Tax=Planotetraspora sp. GP83 TaxID=3156264 RepID=UPI00351175EF
MSELILVVDDVEANRYVIGTWLQHAGYRVTEAATGGAALEAVGRERPDLVLLDVQMPDMDGFEVCERIKADPETAAVPVIHLTATAVDVRDRTMGLTRGADGYLTEPIEPEVLLATVHATLRYARARHRAERLAGRLAGLADTTVAVNTATSLGELLTAAAEGAARMFGCPATVAVSRDDDSAGGGSGGVRYAVADPWGGDGRVRAAAHRTFGDIATGFTLTVAPPEEWAELLAPSALMADVRVALARLGRAHPGASPSSASPSPASQPGGGRPPVAVLVPAAATASEEDRHVLSQLTQAVALAVEALRSYDEERRIAVTLQRSLLPRDLPKVRGMELAARYVPASAQAEIGGDFYEVISLGDRLLVAIGDVLGHSLHAATVMAEVRHALRAYASEGHSPYDILANINRLLLRFHPREIATVCLLLVDPATGDVRACNAGHLPPLLVSTARSEYVTLAGPLLGADLPRPGESALWIPPAGALVLVTDGLVERRDMSIQEGMARLQRLATVVEPDLERFCDRMLEGLMPADHEDDIALVVLRRSPLTGRAG